MPFLVQEAGVERTAYLMRPKSHLAAYFWDTARLPENPTYIDFEWIIFKKKSEAKDIAWRLGQHIVVEVPEETNPKVYPEYCPKDGYYKGNHWYPSSIACGEGSYLRVYGKEVFHCSNQRHGLIEKTLPIKISEKRILGTVLDCLQANNKILFLVNINAEYPILCIWPNNEIFELEAV